MAMATLLRTSCAAPPPSVSLHLPPLRRHASSSPPSSCSFPIFFRSTSHPSRLHASHTPPPSSFRSFSPSTAMAILADGNLFSSSDALLHAEIRHHERRRGDIMAQALPITDFAVPETTTTTTEDDAGEAIECPTVGFFLDDGVYYTSLDVSDHGVPVACNGKGCRPLTGPDCKKLGFLTSSSEFPPTFQRNDTFRSAMEAYYQKLLHVDPRNALVLTNYARLLSQTGDMKKSEEYYERAILIDPHDAEVLSEYAKLQWDVHKDGARAQMYYDQALQAVSAAADDDILCSNIMASYTSFLLESEKDDVTI